MRVAVTIAERSPGNWEVIGGPGPDIHEQKEAVKKLYDDNGSGTNKVLVLSSSGVLKRRRINLPAKRGRPPKAE